MTALAPWPAAIAGLGGWPPAGLDTIYVTSALLVGGWLIVFLLTVRRRDR